MSPGSTREVLIADAEEGDRGGRSEEMDGASIRGGVLGYPTGYGVVSRFGER